jgi:hypothetical protein
LSLALQISQNNYSFTHNDLTPWNIIIQRHKHPIKIEYIVGNRNIQVVTSIVPVMIDFGKSYVVYRDVEYGMNNLKKFSSCIDMLYILLTTIYQIITMQRLNGATYNIVMLLSNYIANTGYHKGEFKTISSIKYFTKNAKKFSVISTSNKYELESRTPLDFYEYIMSKLATYRLPVYERTFRL